MLSKGNVVVFRQTCTGQKVLLSLESCQEVYRPNKRTYSSSDEQKWSLAISQKANATFLSNVSNNNNNNNKRRKGTTGGYQPLDAELSKINTKAMEQARARDDPILNLI